MRVLHTRRRDSRRTKDSYHSIGRNTSLGRMKARGAKSFFFALCCPCLLNLNYFARPIVSTQYNDQFWEPGIKTKMESKYTIWCWRFFCGWIWVIHRFYLRPSRRRALLHNSNSTPPESEGARRVCVLPSRLLAINPFFARRILLSSRQGHDLIRPSWPWGRLVRQGREGGGGVLREDDDVTWRAPPFWDDYTSVFRGQRPASQPASSSDDDSILRLWKGGRGCRRSSTRDLHLALDPCWFWIAVELTFYFAFRDFLFCHFGLLHKDGSNSSLGVQTKAANSHFYPLAGLPLCLRRLCFVSWTAI